MTVTDVEGERERERQRQRERERLRERDIPAALFSSSFTILTGTAPCVGGTAP